MTTAIGWGDFTRRLSDNRLNVVRAGAITLNRSREEEPVDVFPTGSTGPLQTLFNRTTTETWTLTLDSPNIQDTTLPILLDQEIFTGENVEIVVQPAPYTIPSTSPYTVAVPGLVDDQPVSATILRAIVAPGDEYLEQIDIGDVGDIDPGQFAVGDDELTFDEAQAGQTVLINYRTTEASLDIIGGPSPRSGIGSFEVYAKMELLAGNSIWNFWAPNAQIQGDLEFGSDQDTISSEYSLGEVPGWSYPWMMWQIPE